MTTLDGGQGTRIASRRRKAVFDGHDAQRVFADHLEIPALAIVAYLLFVRYGQRWMASRPPFELRTTARVWNVATAAFSICGACVCVPHLARQLAAHGLWYTACADVYELAGYGSVALWAALFTWSKLFELFDTVLLVLRKRRVITLHWFHHSSVIAFAWAAWVYETPCALWYGSMNYSVHAIMYSYFFLTSTRCRRRALRVAPLITALQISQFIWGTDQRDRRRLVGDARRRLRDPAADPPDRRRDCTRTASSSPASLSSGTAGRPRATARRTAATGRTTPTATARRSSRRG